MEISKKIPNVSRRPGNLPGGNGAHDPFHLLETARADTDTVLKGLESQPDGLSEAEAEFRLKRFGMNEIAQEKRQSALKRLLGNIKNPLVLLLLALGVLSFLTGDQRATVVIFVMVVLGVVLRFFQELRADDAAEKLQAMVSNTATLVRDGKEEEVSLKMLVPGDIIRLAAGDMVPADVLVLSAKDLFLNQAALTGEALPVEKKAAPASSDVQNQLELPNICFLGSNVVSGSATAVVLHTGAQTYFGSLAVSIAGQRQPTSFDKGINKFTVIRTNKIPFIESRASWPLTLTSAIIVVVGVWLTVSPPASALGFVPLPPLYWLFLAIILLGYAILTQVVKTWFIRRFGE